MWIWRPRLVFAGRAGRRAAGQKVQNPMAAHLAATFFSIIAAAMAYFFAPAKYKSDALRVCIFWSVAAAGAFLVPIRPLVFVVLAIALLTLAPRQPAGRFAFFLGVFPALPTEYSYNVPFPGLNYLYSINLGALAAIVVLAPMLALPRTRGKGAFAAPALFAIAVLSAVIGVADLPVTSVIRFAIRNLVVIVLPVVVALRALKTSDDYERAAAGFFIAALVLMGVGLLSTAKHWNYYTTLLSDGEHGAIFAKQFGETRNGFLRIYGTLVHTLLGFVTGVGAAIALRFGERRLLPRASSLLVAAAMLFVTFVTGSRGAYLAAAVVATAAWIFPRVGRTGRGAMLAAGGGVAMSLFLRVLSGDSLEQGNGNVAYRAELLRVSIRQIREAPWFGSQNFLEKPQFEALRQGEGIIDIVNMYLQIALSNGLVGLGLFLTAIFSGLNAALAGVRAAEQATAVDGDARDRARDLALAAAMLLGFLAMIATLSDVSAVWQYGVSILGLAIAAGRVQPSSAATV